MWKPFENLIKHTAGSMPANGVPPIVPLRRSTIQLSQLKPGHAILFSESCPLPQLRARKCPIRAVRTYKFGNDTVKSYQLLVEGAEQFSLSVAEDADGHYLAISRQLDPAEQEEWFGRDALSFFTEPSTARTIRCKADRLSEGAWSAERYIKSVDWVDGKLTSERREETPFHYSLLLNETGEKALEIEHYDTVGASNFYVTVYRPVEDILTIAEAIPPVLQPLPTRTEEKVVPLAAQPVFTTPEPEPVAPPAPRPPRTDFRRTHADQPLFLEQEHATSAPAKPEPVKARPPEPALPSFLLSRENEAYISLDEVIPPEPERVRCSVTAAKAIIDVSLQRGVRVRDVLRDLLGLDSTLSEEVIFELPLTEKDYRILAQRYKLRPDHREEIRQRLQEDLRRKLLS